MKRFLILLLIGLTLIGCKSTSNHPNIFEEVGCQPPCWENITPGVTTKNEAVSILTEIEMVDKPISDLLDTARGFDSELRFSLYNRDNLSGSVFFKGDQVSLVDFGTELNITLAHAIELFGIPKNILAFHSNLYWVTLINQETGIAFGYSSAGQPDWVYSEVKPEVEISEVIFFDPGQYEQILESGFFSHYLLSGDEIKSKLHLWNGYGDLTRYEK